MIFVSKAITKFTDPNQSEEFRNPIKEKDCFNTIAIPLSSVWFYEQFATNPDHPYFQYDGPKVRVVLIGEYERIITCTFEAFHKAMCNFKNIDYISITPN